MVLVRAERHLFIDPLFPFQTKDALVVVKDLVLWQLALVLALEEVVPDLDYAVVVVHVPADQRVETGLHTADELLVLHTLAPEDLAAPKVHDLEPPPALRTLLPWALKQ